MMSLQFVNLTRSVFATGARFGARFLVPAGEIVQVRDRNEITLPPGKFPEERVIVDSAVLEESLALAGD